VLAFGGEQNVVDVKYLFPGGQDESAVREIPNINPCLACTGGEEASGLNDIALISRLEGEARTNIFISQHGRQVDRVRGLTEITELSPSPELWR
jgi:hypothetical protein